MKKRAINLVIVATLLTGGAVADIFPVSTAVVAQAATTKTGTVTATSLNVRKSPSTSAAKIGSLKQGANVTIYATSNGWYKIKYGTGYGYVSAQYVSINSSTSNKANKVITEAKKYLGVPYVWGGESPKGFDCSGLVKYVYNKAVGLNLPHSTAQLINKGTAVSQANLKPGDLVFPSSGHVGIYIGNGQMIHAPHKGEVVKISSVYSFYAARRVL